MIYVSMLQIISKQFGIEIENVINKIIKNAGYYISLNLDGRSRTWLI